MADAGSAIFNKKATEKLRSPDDLDKYVRVTNPSVWVVLAACVVLLAGLLAWGAFGSVSTSVSATGVCVKGDTFCFLPTDKATEISVGDAANVQGEKMTVASISPLPVSIDEAKSAVESDYLVSTLMQGDWAYIVSFDGDGDYDFAENVPLNVNITTERITPISLIFGGNS